jgi:Phosphotransferase enzyme family
VEHVLSGGNTHEQVVRINRTVRRPTGPWTPAVHALLIHLEKQSYDGAPRVHGIDERGREVLDYIEGDVVHPAHLDLVEPDAALAEVVQTIRLFHDAAESFNDFARFAWSDRGSDPSGQREILCHNDLAPWNLVHSRNGHWTFIDWDLAAPGRRSWDLAWALLSFIPLLPDSDLSEARILERLRTSRSAYGVENFPVGVLAVARERCQHEAERIDRLGAAGEPPYARLLAEGHGEAWHAAAVHIEAHSSAWQSALK